MQYCSLQHRTLLPSPVTPPTGCCFHVGSISSLFLELFLHSSPGAYWAPTDLRSSSFSVLSFCLFILFMGFSRQEYWSDLPFPSPVDHILSELSTMTCPSCVALHSMAHSFIELDKAVVHVIRLVSSVIMAIVIIFYFLCGYWLWQLINIFYYCDNVINIVQLNHCIMILQQKIVELYITKTSFNRKTYHHLKSTCITELSWIFLKNTDASRYVSNEQPCLKTTRLYDDLLFLSNLFHFSYFTFSVLILFMFSNLSISLFLLLFFLKPSRKACVCVYIICIIYILEHLWNFA